MDINELMSSVNKLGAALSLEKFGIVDVTEATDMSDTKLEKSSGKFADKSDKLEKSSEKSSDKLVDKSLPQFAELTSKAATYEFDMKSTTQHIVKKLTKFGNIVKGDPSAYELESRLIVKPSNNYKVSPNVPIFLFDKILNFFTLNVRHYKFVPWYYTVDNFFADDIRMRKTWSKSGVGAGSATDAKISISWVKKKLIENSDWNINKRPLSMRISLKLEKKVPPLGEPAALPAPLYIQCKQTCSFQDKAVTIFFSYVWQGETEYQARVSIPTRTIEVEVNNSAITPATRPEEIIYNLIARTLELQGLNAPLSLSECT